MPSTSAAMELKVLINILTQGQALPTLLNQTNQLSKALSDLQTKAAAGSGSDATSKIAAGLGDVEEAGRRAASGISTLEGAINKVTSAVRFMAGGFLALEGVRFVKDIADAAARAEVLETTLHIVARNAGISAERIDEVSQNVQRLGITAQSANQSLTQFMQSGLDIKFAAPLARAAQDLAVISGMDSSQTFTRLLTDIQQLNVRGLRWMGIVVSMVEATNKYAQAHGKTANALSATERQQALLNEVLEKSVRLAGSYEAAMGDVGKQLTSLVRYVTNLQTALGKQLLPAYAAIVSELELFLSKTTDIVKVSNANMDAANAWGETARKLAHEFFGLVTIIVEYRKQIWLLIEAYLAYRGVLLALATWRMIVTAIGAVWSSLVGLPVVIEKMTAQTTALAAAWGLVEAEASAAAVAMTEGEAAFWLASGGAAAGGAKAVAGGAGEAAVEGGVLGGLSTWVLTQGKMVLKWFAELAEAILEFGALVAEVFNPVTLAIAGVGVAVGLVTTFFVKFTSLGSGIKSAFGGLVTIFGDLGRVLGGTVNLAWGAFLKMIEMTADRVERSTELWGKFIDLLPEVKNAKAQIESFDKLLGDINKKLESWSDWLDEIYGKMGGTTPADAAQQKLEDLNKQLAAAKDAAEKARVKVRLSPEGGVRDAALKDWQQAVQIEKDSEVKLDNAIKKMKESPDPVVRARAEAIDKANADLLAFNKLIDESTEAAGKLKVTVAGWDVIPKDFDQKLQELNALANTYDAITEKERAARKADQAAGPYVLTDRTADQERIATTLTQRVEAAKETTVSSLAAYKSFVTELDSIKKAIQTESKEGLGRVVGEDKIFNAKKMLDDLETVRQKAQITADAGELAFGAPVVADRKEAARAGAEPAIQKAQFELDGIKSRETTKGQVYEEQYKQNLLTLDEYHEKRKDKIIAEADAELKLLDAQITQMQAVRDVKGQDPKDLAKQDEQIVAARERRRAQVGATEAALQAENIARDARKIELQKELEEATVAIEAKSGSEVATREQINLELEKEKEKYAVLGESVANQLVAIEAITKEYDRQKDIRDKAYKAEDDILKAKQDQLDLAQQSLDLDAARDKAAVSKGDMSEGQAKRRENARLEQQQQLNRAAYAIKEKELQDVINRGLAEEKRLRLELEALQIAGDPITKADIEKRVAAQNAAVESQKAQLQGAMVGLNKSYEDMAASMTSTSQELGKSIADSISKSIADAIVNFRSAKDIFKSLAESIANDMVEALTKPFLQALTSKISGFLTKLLGGGGTPFTSGIYAEGGVVSGPGTGTSDSIPAMLSAGEHVMPAAKAAQWMPLLEGIRLGKVMPAYALGGVVSLQSIAIPSLIPRRYANGGVVVSDGGASAVTPGAAGPGNMIVSLHPDAMQMTMREWLENEVVRQQGRR